MLYSAVSDLGLQSLLGPVCYDTLNTIITLSIGTEAFENSVDRDPARMRRLIRVNTVCHTYSTILDTSRDSKMEYFKF